MAADRLQVSYKTFARIAEANDIRRQTIPGLGKSQPQTRYWSEDVDRLVESSVVGKPFQAKEAVA